jgi:hypothetical protein
MATIVRAKNPTNLNAVNLNSLIDRDVDKYFNNWFDIPVEVSSNVDAAVIAFFENVTADKQSARQIASAVIYTSVKQGINPMETLAEFQKLDIGELDTYTAMFLNFDRVGTSYLGLKNPPLVNKYVQRAILP